MSAYFFLYMRMSTTSESRMRVSESEIGQTRSFCEVYDRVQGRIYIKAIKVWQIGWCDDDDDRINVKSISLPNIHSCTFIVHSMILILILPLLLSLLFFLPSLLKPQKPKNLRIQNTCVPRSVVCENRLTTPNATNGRLLSRDFFCEWKKSFEFMDFHFFYYVFHRCSHSFFVCTIV